MQAVYGDQRVDVSTVRRWLRRFKDEELGQADLSDTTRRTYFKNWCSVGGSVLKSVVILWKNNYAALKIIDVGLFLFCFIKISFPVHFLFKWRQNSSARPRTMAHQPPVGQGLLTIEDSWSHSDTPYSVGFLWTGDQPNAETSIWQHTRDRHPHHRRDSNPQSQQESGCRPTPYTALLMGPAHTWLDVHNLFISCASLKMFCRRQLRRYDCCN
jgi:hypothetical protein